MCKKRKKNERQTTSGAQESSPLCPKSIKLKRNKNVGGLDQPEELGLITGVGLRGLGESKTTQVCRVGWGKVFFFRMGFSFIDLVPPTPTSGRRPSLTTLRVLIWGCPRVCASAACVVWQGHQKEKRKKKQTVELGWNLVSWEMVSSDENKEEEMIERFVLPSSHSAEGNDWSWWWNLITTDWGRRRRYLASITTSSNV